MQLPQAKIKVFLFILKKNLYRLYFHWNYYTITIVVKNIFNKNQMLNLTYITQM
jgi:hypothetical protein